MNLSELQTEVYAITNRPDLADRTLSAIRAQTLKLHQADYFYKDLFESGVVFSTSNYLQQLEYRTLFPRWRSLKYIRKSDVNADPNGKILTVITPDQVVDDYSCNRNDVCYAAGEIINIRSSTDLQYIFLGCYLNPDVTLSGYSSWIATDHPWAIIYNAAAQIFKSIGKQEEWAAAMQDAREQYALVVQSNILAKGE
jgi:hypothetical protein